MKDLVSLKNKQRTFKKRKPAKVTLPEPQRTKVSIKDILRIKSLPKVAFPTNVRFSKAQFRAWIVYVKQYMVRYESDIQLVLFPLILLIIVIILDSINAHLFQKTIKRDVSYYPVSTKLHPYPVVHMSTQPVISANAGIILDRDSQVILYAKNPQLRFSMASTTKIMTALTALDYYKLEDVLTIKRNVVEGSGLKFTQGERYTFKSLLYAMLLPSANDAAMAIADNYPLGNGAFIDRMNKKAQSLHLTNTHFSDPAGLDDDQDYTTVLDLARLASYAISNPTFVDITSTKYKTITSVNSSRQFALTNLNKLLGTGGVTGIKTGTTEGAGEVLVTSYVKGSHTYIIVVMQSTDRFADTQTLMRVINSNVEYVIPTPPVFR